VRWKTTLSEADLLIMRKPKASSRVRQEQSRRDKQTALTRSALQYADPFIEYRAFLGQIRQRGYSDQDFVKIPSNLIGTLPPSIGDGG
jgi:hypothetical protein